MMKYAMAVMASLVVACGGGHTVDPVDPGLTEVRAQRACEALENASNLLQNKQAPCTFSIPDTIPPFKDNPTCWNSPESLGQRCVEEDVSRQEFASCVNLLDRCDTSSTGSWYERATQCVVVFRANLRDPSCDIFKFVP